MTDDAILQDARDAYAQGAWADATDLFLRADEQSRLNSEDLDRLAWAAGIAARDREMLSALERLYEDQASKENDEACARAAFWSGLRHMMIGEVGLGAGWLQRAARHAEQTAPDCVQRGYLFLPEAYRLRSKGDYEAAIECADKAMQFGESAGDSDLVALAGSLKGGMLFRLGRIEDGYVPIDEAMLLANSERLSPLVCGVVYCEIVASLQTELREIAARGYATTTSWREGVYATGAAILDKHGRAVASISISTPESRMTDAKKKEHAQLLIEHCAQIRENGLGTH